MECFFFYIMCHKIELLSINLFFIPMKIIVFKLTRWKNKKKKIED